MGVIDAGIDVCHHDLGAAGANIPGLLGAYFLQAIKLAELGIVRRARIRVSCQKNLAGNGRGEHMARLQFLDVHAKAAWPWKGTRLGAEATIERWGDCHDSPRWQVRTKVSL